MNSAAKPKVARALDGIIFVSLLATLVLIAVPYGAVQPWWVAIFECLVFLLAILALIESSISKRWPVPLDLSLGLPLGALVLFMFVQSLSVSADPYNTRMAALRLIALVVAGSLLCVYTSGQRRLGALIATVIGVGVASALFGLLRKQFQSGPGFFLPALPHDGRGFAQFINRNHFGFLIEMSWGLTLGLLFTKIAPRRRIFIVLPVALFLWIVLIVSNSRGAILASLGQVLFLVFLVDPLKHLFGRDHGGAWSRLQQTAGSFALRAFLIVCLIALFAYGVGWVGGERVTSNLELAATAYDQPELNVRENAFRKQIWSSTWQLIKAHPIAGVGFGGYWIGITKYHDASGVSTPQEAHNDYLELIASGGLIGLAFALWLAVVFVKRARLNLRSENPYLRGVALGAVTGIFGVMIHSFVDFGLHMTINALVFCVLIVLAMQSRPLEHQPGR